MTTFTIFGTYFPDYRLGKIRESVKKLKKIIAKDDKTYISGIKFQVRPGHERKLEEELRKELRKKSSKKNGKLNDKIAIVPAPYRGDISLHFKKKTSFYKFLNYYPAIIKIIRNQKTPVLSLETEFIMDENLLTGLELIEVNKKILKREIWNDEDKETKIDREIINWLTEEKILEEHSLLGFTNLLSDASFLERHYFIKQSMLSWINTIKTLKKFLLSLKEDWPLIDIERKKKLRELLYEQINYFLIFLSHAFTDRFRGIYPVGETSIIPLLTYKTSLQKFLTCIDYICIKTYKDALFVSAGKNLKYPENFSFCSVFTPEFSPANVSFLWFTHAIFITDIFIYKYKLTTYLPHEIGHAFWNSLNIEKLFSKRLSKLVSRFNLKFYKGSERDRDILDEILSDYFALCVGFRGDFNEFTKNFYGISNEEEYEEEYREEYIRKESVKWLYNNISNSSFTSLSFSKKFSLSTLLEKILSSVIKNKSLKKILLNFKNNASEFELFSSQDLFEGERWIKFFLSFFKEI